MSSSAPDPFLTTQHAYEADAQGWAEARNDRSAVRPYIETFAHLTGQGARAVQICGFQNFQQIPLSRLQMGNRDQTTKAHILLIYCRSSQTGIYSLPHLPPAFL